MTPPSESAVAWHEVRPTLRAGGARDVRVAVVSQLDIPGLDAAGRRINQQLTATALQTLVDLGGDVEFFDVTADDAPDLAAIRATDAVCVLGGGDVDATLYGFAGEVPNEGGKDRRSDDRELLVIRDAIERDAPLLAICRGSQLLNVACGGSLVPDLDPASPHRGDTAAGDELFVSEEVRLDPASHIGRALGGRERLVVRGGHHQAIYRPGDRLRVVARAADGVVEGVEHVDATWIAGVQWHPEEAAADPTDRRAVFGALIDEARRRRD